MEIVTYERSVLLRLAIWARKEGAVHLPSIVHAIQANFSFASGPTQLSDIESGIEFGHGVFDGIAIEKLGIYNDGIVFQGSVPTESLDKARQQLLDWAVTEFGFEVVDTHEIDTLYESNLLVKMKKNIGGALNGIETIRRHIESTLVQNSKLKTKYQPAGIVFACDAAKTPGLRPAPFRLERKLSVDFDANLYLTTAPMKTEQHLALLQALEGLL